MKVTFSIDGDIRAIYGDSIREGKAAVTRAMGIAAAQLQANWRNQVANAGLGSRLSRTVRKSVYPSAKTSIHAAALVWSKAPVILDAFERGVLIRSAKGIYLAIPLPAAGAKGLGGKRITPAGWEQRTGLRLHFVYRPRQPSLLVAEGRLNSKGRAVESRSKTGRGLTTVPIFLLVPQVKLPKKLSLLAAAEAAQASVASLIIAEWRRDGETD